MNHGSKRGFVVDWPQEANLRRDVQTLGQLLESRKLPRPRSDYASEDIRNSFTQCRQRFDQEVHPVCRIQSEQKSRILAPSKPSARRKSCSALASHPAIAASTGAVSMALGAVNAFFAWSGFLFLHSASVTRS